MAGRPKIRARREAKKQAEDKKRAEEILEKELDRDKIERVTPTQRALILNESRDRGGVEPMTRDERLVRLRRIRDGSLIWMEQCVVVARGKGAATAQFLYERACNEIARLESIIAGYDETPQFVWAEYEEIDDNGDKPDGDNKPLSRPCLTA